MFFDTTFHSNPIFKKVWLAGYNREITRNVPFRKICKAIHKNHSRLSLRSSAILVNGAARLYKQELDKLMEDLFKMEQEMRQSKVHENVETNNDTPLLSSSTSSPSQFPPSSSSITSSPPTPEQVLSSLHVSDTEESPAARAGRRTSIFSTSTDEIYSKTTLKDSSEQISSEHPIVDDDNHDDYNYDDIIYEESPEEDTNSGVGGFGYMYNGRKIMNRYEPELSTIQSISTISSAFDEDTGEPKTREKRSKPSDSNNDEYAIESTNRAKRLKLS